MQIEPDYYELLDLIHKTRDLDVAKKLQYYHEQRVSGLEKTIETLTTKLNERDHFIRMLIDGINVALAKGEDESQ